MGFFLNNIIPGGVGGEVYKAYMVSRITGKTTQTIASIILVRYIGFTALIIIMGICILFQWETFEKAGILDQLTAITCFLVFMFILSLGIFLTGASFAGKFLLKYTMGVPLVRLMKDLSLYKSHKHALLKALTLTLITPQLEGLAYYFIALSLHGEISFVPFLVLIPILTVIYHIPITINAVGTQDAAIILYLQCFGIDRELSLSISLVAHALRIIVAAIGALFFYFSLRKEGFTVPSENDLTKMASQGSASDRRAGGVI